MKMTWYGGHYADDMVWGHYADDMVWCGIMILVNAADADDVG